MNWYDPKDWLDLVDHAWYGFVLIAVAGVPAWLARKNHEAIRDNNAAIQDVKSQVVNGHKTPMREDLDRALAAIGDLAHDMRGLRADLQAEEESRRAQIADIRDQVGRRRWF